MSRRREKLPFRDSVVELWRRGDSENASSRSTTTPVLRRRNTCALVSVQGMTQAGHPAQGERRDLHRIVAQESAHTSIRLLRIDRGLRHTRNRSSAGHQLWRHRNVLGQNTLLVMAADLGSRFPRHRERQSGDIPVEESGIRERRWQACQPQHERTSLRAQRRQRHGPRRPRWPSISPARGDRARAGRVNRTRSSRAICEQAHAAGHHRAAEYSARRTPAARLRRPQSTPMEHVVERGSDIVEGSSRTSGDPSVAGHISAARSSPEENRSHRRPVLPHDRPSKLVWPA